MQVQLQFPQVISKVIASGPRLRVKLRMIGSGFDVTRALENGEIDLVIGGPNPGPQLLIEYLYDEEVVCVMRSGHVMAKRPRVSFGPLPRPQAPRAASAVHRRTWAHRWRTCQGGLQKTDRRHCPRIQYDILRAHLHGPRLHLGPALCRALRETVVAQDRPCSQRAAADEALSTLARTKPCERVQSLAAETRRRRGQGPRADVDRERLGRCWGLRRWHFRHRVHCSGASFQFLPPPTTRIRAL